MSNRAKSHAEQTPIRWERLSKVARNYLLTRRSYLYLGKVLLWSAAVFVVVLFLPWRQTIPGRGSLTAFRPQDRPQTIQNQIGGRIERWAVQEGEEVQAGDTILVLSEIAQSFFDPELPTRLEEQLMAKRNSEQAADQKMSATNAQIDALTAGLRFQLEAAENKVTQARNVVRMDSADLVATKLNYETNQARLERYEQGYLNGLFSLTDIETRRLNMQNDRARVVSSENKLVNSRQSLLNASIDLDNIRASYSESLAKAQSDLGSAFSNKASAQGDIAKLRNEIANIDIRRGLYVVRAPQSGFVVKTMKAGIGETIKDGESIATLQPKTPMLAAELYVNAIDVPLILNQSHVRLEFEGWPSIQIAGWPSVAVGTFPGRVAVIDKVASDNGRYRILVVPDIPTPEGDEPWPEQIRIGSGVFGRVILHTVPVWYEIWRQVNGFPPSLRGEPDKEAAR